MKTSVIEMHDMLSVFSVEEVEKRIGEVPGVESATVNFAAGNATVRFDETRLDNADIKSAVRQRGYYATTPAAEAGKGGEGQTVPGAAPATAATPPIAPVPPAPPDTASPSTPLQDKASPPTAPETPPEPLAETPAASAGDEQKDKTTSDKS